MSEAELTRIIGLYSNIVFRTAMCYVKNKSDADDIMQDVFLKIYTYDKPFRSDEHIKAWLIRAAANRSKNLLRSGWYRFSQPLETAEDKVCDEKEENRLPAIIMKLKPEMRHTLYLFYYEGYSVKEIAAVTGKTETAVTSRLSRGRRQLKKLIEKEHYHEL